MTAPATVRLAGPGLRGRAAVTHAHPTGAPGADRGYEGKRSTPNRKTTDPAEHGSG